MTGKALFVFDPSLFQDDEDAVDNQNLTEEQPVDNQNDEELNKGGKKWEAKKVQAVEEDQEEENIEEKAQNNGNTEGSKENGHTKQPETNVEDKQENVKIDEELFDEEELPDDID